MEIFQYNFLSRAAAVTVEDVSVRIQIPASCVEVCSNGVQMLLILFFSQNLCLALKCQKIIQLNHFNKKKSFKEKRGIYV